MNVLRRSLVYVLAALLTVPSPVFAAGIVADPAAAPGRRPDVTAAQPAQDGDEDDAPVSRIDFGSLQFGRDYEIK